MNSINEVLSFDKTVGDAFTSTVPWTTGFINLLKYQDVFMSYPELSNNNFHTPSSFNNAVVKQVPVNASFASVIYDTYGISEYDYINVSKRTVKRLTFRVLDGSGNVIDLNALAVSFSLLFHNTDLGN